MARYEGPIIDTDVHHQIVDSEVIEYFTAPWKDYIAGGGRRLPLQAPSATGSALLPTGGALADSYPEDGSRPGSDYGLLNSQLLDKYGYFRALLTHGVGDFATHLNQYFTVELTRAINDWNIDKWLGHDDRLYSVVLVPTALPDVAAKEIRRVGTHSNMAGVLLCGDPIGRPFGDPLLHPIYEAAAEVGIPIVFHVSGCDRPNSQMRTVGGPKWNPMQLVPESGQSAMHHISSFIVHGVFEKYPGLKLLFNEYGVSWLPNLVLRLDENYDLLRLESPWLKKRPSEYIHDHVRLSTQPLEESPDDKGGLVRLMETVDGVKDILVFSSDYPHISFDEPTYIARLLPAAWQRKVFCENACELFGWSLPAEDWVNPALAGTGTR
jgi:uncharacterized protein